MARKLNRKAKQSFIAFSTSILLAVGGFSVAVSTAAKAQSENYELLPGSTVYDNAYARVDFDTEAKVYRGWDKSYRMVTEHEKEYNLGRQTVAYEPSSDMLTIFGGGYRFHEDGTVDRLDSCTRITDLEEPGFYKLSDRKYLLTGGSIRDEKGAIETADYAYLIADKSGNVHVLNENLDVKVLEATAFQTGDMTFTVKDEALDLGLERSVNLAMVMGSLHVVEDPFNLGQKFYSYTIKGGDGGSGGSGGTGGTGGLGGLGGLGGSGGLGGFGGSGGSGGLGGEGGAGGDGGSGGTGGAGGLGGTGGTGGAGGSLDNAGSNQAILGRMNMVLKRVTAGTSSLDIRYSISDPFGYYGVIELRVSPVSGDEDEMLFISVSPDDTETTFVNLAPDTQYKIELGYWTEEQEFLVMDSMRTSTEDVDCEFYIEEVTWDSIWYYLRLGEDVAVSSLLIKMDGVDTVEADPLEVCSEDGAIGMIERPGTEDDRSTPKVYTLELYIVDDGGNETLVKRARIKNPDADLPGADGTDGDELEPDQEDEDHLSGSEPSGVEEEGNGSGAQGNSESPGENGPVGESTQPGDHMPAGENPTSGENPAPSENPASEENALTGENTPAGETASTGENVPTGENTPTE